MSRTEFEQWFTPKRQNEAMAVALTFLRRSRDAQLHKSKANWRPDAEDIVQQAVTRALAAHNRLVIERPDRALGEVGAWPFLTEAIKSATTALIRSYIRRAEMADGAGALMGEGRGESQRDRDRNAGWDWHSRYIGPAGERAWGRTRKGRHGYPDQGKASAVGAYPVYPEGAQEQAVIEAGFDREHPSGRRLRVSWFVHWTTDGRRRYEPLTLEPGRRLTKEAGPNHLVVTVDPELARCLGVLP